MDILCLFAVLRRLLLLGRQHALALAQHVRVQHGERGRTGKNMIMTLEVDGDVVLVRHGVAKRAALGDVFEARVREEERWPRHRVEDDEKV